MPLLGYIKQKERRWQSGNTHTTLGHPVERCQCYSTSTAGFHVKWDSQFFFFFFLALSCAILVGSSMRAQRGEKSYLIVNSFWAPMHNVVKCMKKSHLYACTLWFDVLVAFPMLFVHFVLEFLGRAPLLYLFAPWGKSPKKKWSSGHEWKAGGNL